MTTAPLYTPPMSRWATPLTNLEVSAGAALQERVQAPYVKLKRKNNETNSKEMKRKH